MEITAGLFGRVADVKAMKSLGVCRVIVEVPIEQHKAVTSAFWDTDVLITPSTVKSYGMASAKIPPETSQKSGYIVEVEEEKQYNNEPENYGKNYQALYKSGFFNNPALWRAIGTDEEYQAWTREQLSCVSGTADWIAEIGENRCEYAHVRRVSNGSGMGIKPEYSGVPLTHKEHALQHLQGEQMMLNQCGKTNINTPSEAAAWFEMAAAENRTAWIRSEIYAHFGVESLRQIEPEKFAAWIESLGLRYAIPSAFFQTA